jgi:hypothetical protein
MEKVYSEKIKSETLIAAEKIWGLAWTQASDAIFAHAGRANSRNREVYNIVE